MKNLYVLKKAIKYVWLFAFMLFCYCNRDKESCERPSAKEVEAGGKEATARENYVQKIDELHNKISTLQKKINNAKNKINELEKEKIEQDRLAREKEKQRIEMEEKLLITLQTKQDKQDRFLLVVDAELNSLKTIDAIKKYENEKEKHDMEILQEIDEAITDVDKSGTSNKVIKDKRNALDDQRNRKRFEGLINKRLKALRMKGAIKKKVSEIVGQKGTYNQLVELNRKYNKLVEDLKEDIEEISTRMALHTYENSEKYKRYEEEENGIMEKVMEIESKKLDTKTKEYLDTHFPESSSDYHIGKNRLGAFLNQKKKELGLRSKL